MVSTTEAELDNFRREWREEVSRNKTRVKRSSGPQVESSTARSRARRNGQEPFSSSIIQHDQGVESGEGGNTSHYLEGIGYGRKLSDVEFGEKSNRGEPETALEYYERAVEKETEGALGASLGLYRKAFKLDDRVHDTYKQKHFPASSFLPKVASPELANQNPPSPSSAALDPANHILTGVSPGLSLLLSQFATLRIEGEVPPTEADPPPPCPIAELPEELLVEVLVWLAITDVSAFVRLAQVCKRLAYLVAAEDRVWKRIVEGQEFGFESMHYNFAVTVEGESQLPLLSPALDISRSLNTSSLPLTSDYPTYLQMFRSRPRIRFNGAYISTVNYTRPGASSANSLSWGSPVLIVTYYRYLRFFRDGSCISLCTTAEPSDVVPYLLKEHLPAASRRERGESALPSAVMKDAHRGRWRLSGQPSREGAFKAEGELQEEEGVEVEGDVHIETEGVSPKYLYKMQLAVANTGRSARNIKLAWKGYWSYNKLTDDWSVFTLRNDRAFWFSRVKSYGLGMNAGF